MVLEVKFVGGLGNQMFQYAAARSLCIKRHIPFLVLNPDSYNNESLGRTFALAQMRIKGTIVENGTIKKIFRKRTKLNKIFTKLRLHKNIEEEKFNLQRIDDKTGILTSLHGYWHSAWYFNSIRPALLKELIPLKIPAWPTWISYKNTVAVHVRRTDYMEENRYGFIGENYYREAIALMKKKEDNPVFIFFSDDMAWCQITFKGPGIIFCNEKEWDKDYLQVYLMSKCNHQIVANSSFSWWGAWLNNNPGKIVIRPSTPFKEKSLLYESHYPDEWIAINN